MPWIPFTEDHIKSRIASRELEVYEETAQSEYPEEGGDAVVPNDAVERLPSIVIQVLAQFRGAIRANPQATYIGPPGTLPDFCIASAAIFGRVALVGLNPVPEGMTDPRRDEYKNAEKFLESLSTMSPAAFLEADTPSESSTGGGSFGGNALICF